jgi:hypothetical protein
MATRKTSSTSEAVAKKAPARKAPVKAAENAARKSIKKTAAKSSSPAKVGTKTAAGRKKAPGMPTGSAAKQAVKDKGKKAATGKATATKSVAKQVPAKKARSIVTNSPTAPRAAKTASRATPAKPAGKSAPRNVTPRQALAKTRKLLEQKQAHDRETQPWQLLDPNQTPVAEAGFQSNEAADKAVELHAAESRMKAIQGSSGTQDRRKQGKRDNR